MPETSQNKHLFWDMFETSLRGHKKGIFFEIYWRCLKDVSKKISFLRCFWEVFEMSLSMEFCLRHLKDISGLECLEYKRVKWLFFSIFLNKFLKHVINIVLKWNNYSKCKKLFFWQKNEPQISGFAIAKKVPSPWKKIFWKKKYFHFIYADKMFKTVGGFLFFF